MSDVEKETREWKRHTNRLRFALGITILQTVCLIIASIGVAVIYKDSIFTGTAACTMRVIFGMLMAGTILQLYMIGQEFCTFTQVSARTTKYGCHKMATHQFFMHCVTFAAVIIAIILNQITYPDSHRWIGGIAGAGAGMMAVNIFLRIAIIHDERERTADKLPSSEPAPTV